MSLKTDDPAFESELLEARHDQAQTVMDTSVSIDVLSNDSLGVTPTSISQVGTPSSGTVALDSNSGMIHYTPITGFVGTDNFTYTIVDDEGQSSSATVTVQVAAS